MKNKIEIFENSEFGTVRALEIDGEPWFVGRDVALILGYSNASKAVSMHVDNEDKLFKMLDIADSQNGNVSKGQSKTAFINESGLYSLILSSKLPKAKEFKRWVTNEVLPSIRKTGGYHVPTIDPEQLSLMKLNAKARVAEIWLAISGNTQNQTYKDICNTYAANTLAEKEVFALPAVTEKTYTATEIGKLLGVSASKIGRLANTHGLKTSEYGKYFYDKSRYSNKEVETFRYFKKAIEIFRELLS